MKDLSLLTQKRKKLCYLKSLGTVLILILNCLLLTVGASSKPLIVDAKIVNITKNEVITKILKKDGMFYISSNRRIFSYPDLRDIYQVNNNNLFITSITFFKSKLIAAIITNTNSFLLDVSTGQKLMEFKDKITDITANNKNLFVALWNKAIVVLNENFKITKTYQLVKAAVKLFATNNELFVAAKLDEGFFQIQNDKIINLNSSNSNILSNNLIDVVKNDTGIWILSSIGIAKNKSILWENMILSSLIPKKIYHPKALSKISKLITVFAEEGIISQIDKNTFIFYNFPFRLNVITGELIEKNNDKLSALVGTDNGLFLVTGGLSCEIQ